MRDLVERVRSWLTSIPESVRAYFYRVAAAALVVLPLLDDGIDVTDPTDAAALLGLLAAVLATANTSR